MPVLLAPLIIALVGCGTSPFYSPHAATESFSISASTTQLTTNDQVRFTAKSKSGNHAAVSWAVGSGQNDSVLGQGSIDATGLYTPPAALSRDSIQVLVSASLQIPNSVEISASTIPPTVTASLTVTPGFLQPLTPENATLAPNATLQIKGQIAQVNGGTIEWSFDPAYGDESHGSLFPTECQRSPQNYTTCTVIYRAPSTVPVTGTRVSLRGTIVGPAGTTSTAPVAIRLSAEGVSSTPLVNQAAQTGPIQLGSSGSNNSDYDADGEGNVLECCGGTLGALVASRSSDEVGNQTPNQYILSNNHVLAESDQAPVGDTILQPGLIDSGCSAHPARGAGRPIGALKYFVPLGTSQSNVDATLALVSPGAVDSSGAILQLAQATAGTSANLAAAPPAGGNGEAIGAGSFSSGAALTVAKSGRTTGLTCSAIDAIDLDVRVDYFKDCAETQPYFTKTFTGQIGIPGNGFADSGDSGALVVDSRNAEPVGLLFATGGSATGEGYSVANPIHDVLAELGAQAGKQFSIVGGGEHPVSCLNYDREKTPDLAGSNSRLPGLAASGLADERITAKVNLAVQTARAAMVRRSQGIVGATAGRSADNPREAAVVLYLDRTYADNSVRIPHLIDGVRTVVISADTRSVEAGTAPTSPSVEPGLRLPASILLAAADIQRQFARQLMSDPAIFGVGVTQSYDHPSEAAILILVDTHRTPRATPPVIGGLRVRYVDLDRFHVTKSKYATAPRSASCAPPSASQAEWTLSGAASKKSREVTTP